jgi:hypothetical protein
VAIALALLTAAVALQVLAETAAWGSFEIRLGPLLLVAYERSSEASTWSYGPAVAGLVAVGGVVNAAAARFVGAAERPTSEPDTSRTP